MFTEEEQIKCDTWWAKVGAAFKSLPPPEKPEQTAEVDGMKFKSERWRDGITWEWCLSWKLIAADGSDSCVNGRRRVDPNQED